MPFKLNMEIPATVLSRIFTYAECLNKANLLVLFWSILSVINAILRSMANNNYRISIAPLIK